VGVLLAGLGVWLVRQSPTDYAEHAHMDWFMLAMTLVAAVLSSVLAAIVPAWQATRVPPALQIKTS
jgi:putative ABC transport system permease protein